MNNSSSDSPQQPYSQASLIGLISFNIIIIVAALLGNTLVITAVCRTRKLRKPTNYFVVSLAVSDILIVTTIVPFHVYLFMNSMMWELGLQVCEIWIFMDFFCSSASTTNVALIACDRLLALSYPFRYQRLVSDARSAFAILVVWCYAAVLSSLSFMKWSDDAELSHTPACYKIDKNFYMVVPLLGIFLPLVVLIVAYSIVFKLAFRQVTMIKAHSTPLQTIKGVSSNQAGKPEKSIQTRMLIREMKATKTLMIVVGIFLLCWLPLFILLLVNQYCPKCITRELSFVTQQIIGIIFVYTLPRLSSVANPIIYTTFNREFRSVLCAFCDKITRVLSRENVGDGFLPSRRRGAAGFCGVRSHDYLDSTTNANTIEERIKTDCYECPKTTNRWSRLQSVFVRRALGTNWCYETSV